MGHYGVLQVYRPGGILNASGTPNFLRDLSGLVYQAQWVDNMQGGLDKAAFDCRMEYEDTLDLVFGNWITWGCLGAVLSSNGSPGDGSVTVTDLLNYQIPTLYDSNGNASQNRDLRTGDLVILTDGANAELFKVSAISGHGPTWTVTLGYAWGNVQVRTATTLFADAAASSSTIDVTSGALTNGDNIAIGSDSYTVSSVTQKNKNGQAYWHVGISPSTVQSYSAGTPISKAGAGSTTFDVETAGGSGNAGLSNGQAIWLDSGGPNEEQAQIQTVSGQKRITLQNPLAKGHGGGAPILFKMASTLSNSYASGQARLIRVEYQGYIQNRIHSTLRPSQFSIVSMGFFNRYNYLIDSSTVQDKSADEQMRYDLASYASTVPGIIVNNATPGEFLATATGNLVNIQATDQTFVELIDTILRQENGSSTDIQYAVWVGQDRIVRHLPIATNPNSIDFVSKGHTYKTPTYYISLQDGSGGLDPSMPVYGDTINSVQTTDMDGTNLMNAAIVTGTTNPDGSHRGTDANSTTLAQSYAHTGPNSLQMIVTSIPSSWQPLNGQSGLYILAGRGSSAQGVQPFVSFSGDTITLGSAFNKDFPLGTNVELCTELTGSHSSGDQTFTVKNAGPFSSGQEITFTPTGATEESLTIQTIDYGSNKITTTTACKKNHAANDVACLASNGSGSGPRIIVELTKSILDFGWFEGTLNSQDIYDEKKLAEWAGQQLKVTAWPVVNAQVQLSTTAARINGRDLVYIGPFKDGSTMIQNVIRVQYNATAADQNVAATLDLGVLRSTASTVIRQIAKERVKRHRYKTPRLQGGRNGHAGGLTVNQSAANQATIDAGSVIYLGNVYPVPAATITLAEGESRWGVSCGPAIASPAIVELPYRNWNGRKVYSHSNVYQIQENGDQPQVIDSFTGIPLYKIKVRNGNVVGVEPLFDTVGTDLTKMPNPSYASGPTLSGAGATAYTFGTNPNASDIAVSGTITNFPTDGATHEAKLYVRTSGSPAGFSHKATWKCPGLPQPTASQAFSIIVKGLDLGETIDFGLSFNGVNGESPITVIVSSYSNGTAPPFTTMPLQNLATVPTPGSSTPSPINANGTLGFCAAASAGVNNRLWVYDSVSGWQPVTLEGP